MSTILIASLVLTFAFLYFYIIPKETTHDTWKLRTTALTLCVAFCLLNAGVHISRHNELWYASFCWGLMSITLGLRLLLRIDEKWADEDSKKPILITIRPADLHYVTDFWEHSDCALARQIKKLFPDKHVSVGAVSVGIGDTYEEACSIRQHLVMPGFFNANYKALKANPYLVFETYLYLDKDYSDYINMPRTIEALRAPSLCFSIK